MQFLDAEQGVCAGMGGLIAPRAVRHLLVDRLQALNATQCDAFLRRINPRGACLVSFEELEKYLSDRSPKTARQLPHDDCAAFAPNAFEGVGVATGGSCSASSVPRFDEQAPQTPPHRTGRMAWPSPISGSSSHSSRGTLSYQAPWSGGPAEKDFRSSTVNWSPALSMDRPAHQVSISHGSLAPNVGASRACGASPGPERRPWHSMGRSPYRVSWRENPTEQAVAHGKLSADGRAPCMDDLDTTKASSRDGPAGVSPSPPLRRYSRSCELSPATSNSAILWSPEHCSDPRHSFIKDIATDSPRRSSNVLSDVSGRWVNPESGTCASLPARWESPKTSYEDRHQTERRLAEVVRATFDAGPEAQDREDLTRSTLQAMLHQVKVDVRSPAAAEELEQERRKLVTSPGYNFFSFDDVFHSISCGKAAFTFEDLRMAYVNCNIPVSEHELVMLFHRYAPTGEVTFPDFLRQVKPRFY